MSDVRLLLPGRARDDGLCARSVAANHSGAYARPVAYAAERCPSLGGVFVIYPGIISDMKKHNSETPIADDSDKNSRDDLRRNLQISLDEVRAGKGISAEESLRQLELDEANALSLEREDG